MEETWVWSLLQEDSTWYGATELRATNTKHIHSLCSTTTEAVPQLVTTRESLLSSEDPAQPKINFKKW